MKKLLVFFILISWYNVGECNTRKYMLKDEECILAIIGEAEGESFDGKLAVAETIRHRGNLKGVYGINAPRVKEKKFSQSTYDEAKRAWEASKTSNVTGKADGWGNKKDLETFNKQAWFKNCKVVYTIGGHFFWKDMRG